MRDVCKRSKAQLLEELREEEWLLKVCGREEYCYEREKPIHSLLYVRECLEKRKAITFSMVNKEKVPKEDENFFRMVNTSRFEEKKNNSLQIDFTNSTLSTDVKEPLSLFLQDVSNLNLKLIGGEQLSQLVEGWRVGGKPVWARVKMAVHYAQEQISETLFSSPSPLLPSASKVSFSQFLSFSLLISNIPKESVLSFTLYLSPSSSTAYHNSTNNNNNTNTTNNNNNNNNSTNTTNNNNNNNNNDNINNNNNNSNGNNSKNGNNRPPSILSFNENQINEVIETTKNTLLEENGTREESDNKRSTVTTTMISQTGGGSFVEGTEGISPPQTLHMENFVVENANESLSPTNTNTTIGSRENEEEWVALGWVNVPLFNYLSQLIDSRKTLKLWPNEEANPIGTCIENISSRSPTLLTLNFTKRSFGIVYPPLNFSLPSNPPNWKQVGGESIGEGKRSEEEERKLEELLSKDPLYNMSKAEKEFVWKYRHICLEKKGDKLPKVLQCCNWKEVESVQEAYNLLSYSPPMSPIASLELLDCKFKDANVRSYAVERLRELEDEQFSDYLLQLVQVLKYEPFHFSSLASLLIERALKNRTTIGSKFFWYLQAEMHVPEIFERFGLLLEFYLRGCGEQLSSILKEKSVVNKLKALSKKLSPLPLEKRRAVLVEELKKTELPPSFRLPIFPTSLFTRLLVEKSRVMDSAKAPLKLDFVNYDKFAPPTPVLFKCGDDLRQDVLTLQILNIMDKLWKQNKLDLRLTLYACIATDEESGLIEIVPDSQTEADIQKEAGGATAAFSSTVIQKHLTKKNPSEENFATSVRNFAFSCAGYSVATYVLGIGDRRKHSQKKRKSYDISLFFVLLFKKRQ